jgi:hypothetical protein
MMLMPLILMTISREIINQLDGRKLRRQSEKKPPLLALTLTIKKIMKYILA